MRMRKLVALIALSFSVSACSGMYKHTLDYNPRESLRVAVLPFVFVNDSGEIIENSGTLGIDNVSLLSSEVTQTPEMLVRDYVRLELSNTALDMLAPAVVDGELPHHGFGKKDGSFNLEKIYSVSPDKICVHFLDCDAVLYGKVKKWDRSYYGIQSNNAVAIELTLVAVKDSEVLFAANAEDSHSRGLLKGPTGYFSIFFEPIKGLDSEIISDLAREVVQKALEPLRIENRPEYLKVPPPSIFASAHDAVGSRVKRNAPLTVLLFGSSGMKASFSIGDTIHEVPMSERSDGHYFGEYFPLSSDRFENQEVVVSLEDEFGRKTEKKISAPAISLQ